MNSSSTSLGTMDDDSNTNDDVGYEMKEGRINDENNESDRFFGVCKTLIGQASTLKMWLVVDDVGTRKKTPIRSSSRNRISIAISPLCANKRRANTVVGKRGKNICMSKIKGCLFVETLQRYNAAKCGVMTKFDAAQSLAS